MIDGHLDLACVALEGRDLTTPCRGDGCISLPDLRDGGIDLCFATIFTHPVDAPCDDPMAYERHDRDAAFAEGVRQLEMYEALEERGELRIVRTMESLDDDGPRPAILILMEGADPIRSAEEVAWWHERGLRLVGLTWSHGTRYAGGNGRHGPLTDEGVDLVKALDAHDIIHDVSHLADAAFDGLMQHASGRIVATHSNCRTLMDGVDQRHLRDDQIRAIAEHDGVVGLNLYTAFLRLDERATLEHCLDHVEHVADLMGHRRGVALGSDADGGFGPESLPVNVDHPTRFRAIGDGLRTRGWSDDEVAGFNAENWRRILRRQP